MSRTGRLSRAPELDFIAALVALGRCQWTLASEELRAAVVGSTPTMMSACLTPATAMALANAAGRPEIAAELAYAPTVLFYDAEAGRAEVQAYPTGDGASVFGISLSIAVAG